MTTTGEAFDVGRARTDVVGSLLRPTALIRAFAEGDAGTLSRTELEAVQDQAVRDVVAEQSARGLSIVSDGEFRRRHFMESFADVRGFAHGKLAPVGLAVVNDADETAAQGPRLVRGYRERGHVVEPLALVRNRVLDEFSFAQAQTDRVVKASLITPMRVVGAYDPDRSGAVYDDLDAFLADVVAIQREMIEELVRAGCRYVHVDAPDYATYVDEHALLALQEAGESPAANLARAIRIDNAVMVGFADVTFGLHVCRGNFRGRWAREGSYDAIAERLYNEVGHERLLLEYDDERAGGFESLRHVPKGKVAVLGLISTKRPEVETVDALERRIEEAARFLPLDQLAISPQCGFGSVMDGNPLDEEVQWRKLEVMMETAQRVWG